MRRRRALILLAQGAGACFAGTRSEPAPSLERGPEPTTERAASSPLADRLEVLAAELRAARADDGFTVVVEPPFIVAGDEAPAVVERRARTTVGWASTRLKEAYFEADPPEAPTVWLFRDQASYRRWSKALFDDVPDTPYGYYTPEHNALVMNIATGGGTLVHEMVHPFIDADFPSCPSWFDEGLASLYEQCGERDGKIVGFENWRLPGLQAHIEAGSLPSFNVLTHTTREAFYADDTGVHYAQARYLCFYLQERGLLRRYYRDFKAAVTTDPSGYATLQTTLGTHDMNAFASEWTRFVMKLSFG